MSHWADSRKHWAKLWATAKHKAAAPLSMQASATSCSCSTVLRHEAFLLRFAGMHVQALAWGDPNMRLHAQLADVVTAAAQQPKAQPAPNGSAQHVEGEAADWELVPTGVCTSEAAFATLC
jgi:hypothetical protein